MRWILSLLLLALVGISAALWWTPIAPAAPPEPGADLAAAPAPYAGRVVYLPVVERNADPLAPAPVVTPLSYVLTGQVYDLNAGPSRGIAGADVSVSVCQARAYHAVSNADGRYTLSLPMADLNSCPQVTLGAAAPGYTPQYTLIAVVDLLADQERNFALAPLSGPQPTPVPGPW